MGTQVAALRDALGARQAVAARACVDVLARSRDGRDDALDVLAAAGRDGDGLAAQLLIELVDRSGAARAAARSVLVDEQAVEEVAQDTLVAVATSLGAFRREARFSTWLHGIARRRAVDHLRALRGELPPIEERPAQRISSLIASRATVDQVLARLPDQYRRAVVLRDVEQLAYDAVAARLGCPPSTARTRVNRGRALLARMLTDEGAAGVESNARSTK